MLSLAAIASQDRLEVEGFVTRTDLELNPRRSVAIEDEPPRPEHAQAEIDSRAVQHHEINGSSQSALEIASEVVGLAFQRAGRWFGQQHADVNVAVAPQGISSRGTEEIRGEDTARVGLEELPERGGDLTVHNDRIIRVAGVVPPTEPLTYFLRWREFASCPRYEAWCGGCCPFLALYSPQRPAKGRNRTAQSERLESPDSARRYMQFSKPQQGAAKRA